MIGLALGYKWEQQTITYLEQGCYPSKQLPKNDS